MVRTGDTVYTTGRDYNFADVPAVLEQRRNGSRRIPGRRHEKKNDHILGTPGERLSNNTGHI